MALLIPIIGSTMNLTIPSVAGAQGVDTVIVGRLLNTVGFRPRVDTVDLYDVLGTTRRLTGTMYIEYEVAPPGSDAAFLIRSTTPGGVVGTALLRAGTLAPVRTRNQAPRDSADVSFTSTEARGWVVPAGADRKVIEISFAPGRAPFASASNVMSALPLAEGYSAVLPTLDAYVGRIAWRTLKVIRSDTVTYRGRIADTWIVEEGFPETPNRPPRQYWIDKISRRMLKSHGGLPRADGSEGWWFVR
jgi:hypothetical protein